MCHIRISVSSRVMSLISLSLSLSLSLSPQLVCSSHLFVLFFSLTTLLELAWEGGEGGGVWSISASAPASISGSRVRVKPVSECVGVVCELCVVCGHAGDCTGRGAGSRLHANVLLHEGRALPLWNVSSVS